MKPILFLAIVIISMSIFTIGITFAQVAPVFNLPSALFKTDKGEYQIQYNITNARLEATFVDIGARAFMFIVNATEDGQLSVDLPRKIIDSTRDGKDRPYLVYMGDPFGGGGLMRIKVDEIRNNSETRIITINFTRGLNQVQLSGTFFVENNYPRTNMTLYNGEMSPLKQWQLGADPLDVICKNGFQLIIKARDDLPACVKPMTAEKLVQRGWGDCAWNCSDQILVDKSTSTIESFNKKYDAVIKGKIEMFMGHKENPTMYQSKVEIIAVYKTHSAIANENTITILAERNMVTEPGASAIMGLDYDKARNYFRLADRFVMDANG